ncbi:MAG: alpha-L-arabinofuranosidase [Flavisolibacter sp.]|nr:alpha-L-arabinofuranosidase [Flavisolibacter sp.]
MNYYTAYRSELRRLQACVLAGVIVSCGTSVSAQSQNRSQLVVNASEIKATIEPTMWGVFFEDINMGADGGIYAELIKNRSFEFFKPMMGWKVLSKVKTEGDFLVMNRQEAATANPRFLHITLHKNSNGRIGLSNEGFKGMGIKKGNAYAFSVMYRQLAPELKCM